MPTPKQKTELELESVAFTKPIIPNYKSIGVFYGELANGEQYIDVPLSGTTHDLAK